MKGRECIDDNPCYYCLSICIEPSEYNCTAYRKYRDSVMSNLATVRDKAKEKYRDH